MRAGKSSASEQHQGFAVEIENYAVLREVVCKSNWDCNKNLSLKPAVSSLGKHKPACPRGILRGWIQTNLMDRIEDRVLLVPIPNCLPNINLIVRVKYNLSGYGQAPEPGHTEIYFSIAIRDEFSAMYKVEEGNNVSKKTDEW
ncbi:predicted protein [Histoplasma capsulatum G186AR]|uniref:Uncharacterized protein n=1 Tax=Ajellomyces capsulatus (strain G186AR / H82 / ATCC MYA-2454 / RMSCC 2432) TaxID=447093 RepID=C0NXL7_AJECG|nr:uncharacterized protein HCBG_08209 [Histoplasma capsulatum G186AR]EEH04083.1 predicted protein [Histoplasma capsulatum G186AR]